MKYWKYNLAESESPKEVDVRKYTSMNKDIESVIDLFNNEIDWNDMYSIDDCYKRFNDGCFCFLLYQKEQPIGICWHYDIRPNVFGFNGFVSKKKKNENGISQKFFDMMNYILYKEGYQTYIAYCDDWNEKMWNRATKTKGFQPISVHMFNDMIGAAKKKTYF
jgi:RimJ/RimL family protein N-acetyltransferase|tara:strand:+ start:71 stop:559 length:489 start_codon:yes stop_codon:yes gene_type:complete